MDQKQTTPAIPTREEVDKLKKDWLHDPCWDIEHTEGFEHYHDELKAFHDEKRTQWDKQRQEREQAAFEQWVKKTGLTEDTPERTYLYKLEGHYTYMFEKMQEQIDFLQRQLDNGGRRGY